jgi:hypothetical protein
MGGFGKMGRMDKRHANHRLGGSICHTKTNQIAACVGSQQK